jgi:four helix bundle protein
MNDIRRHQDLKAWQMAMSLVKLVYRLTTTFPKEEIFGLTSQMRRAAVSVPSNIAEGALGAAPENLCNSLGWREAR